MLSCRLAVFQTLLPMPEPVLSSWLLQAWLCILPAQGSASVAEHNTVHLCSGGVGEPTFTEELGRRAGHDGRLIGV